MKMSLNEFADKYLTKPVAKRYILNIKKISEVDVNRPRELTSFDLYIEGMFSFGATPEGFDYWRRIANDVINKGA